MEHNILLKVASIKDVAQDIREIEFVSADTNFELPKFEAGAHIEIKLKEDLYRSYSLANDCSEAHRYVVAVHRSPVSKGGSSYIHQSLKEGDLIFSTAPRNNFPLDESTENYVLIAGGIGITPILAMAYRLNALGKAWTVHYCARTRQHAAYQDQLTELSEKSGNKVQYYFDHEADGQSLNLAELARSTAAESHFYCCGPKGMLNAFEAATEHRKDTAHLEYFSAKEEAALDGGYEIELAKSNLILKVPAGKSILDVVFEAGVSVPSSCREGICGSCETTIISGEADHRDALLSDEEKVSNQTMMICCSGAKSKKLVLDL
ncbi:oxidoreductase [Acinetobacter sp. LoGeW2-3]|uniref:PDR/VanB family oxidoreductase n=1 Tax=Acinetobacter sp. LoGeW2-3 TaxID=1808001 RepID=UPI000C05ADB9|nr:PDR/VanB family oxidoreductase [Acinetobacter sp. LoGeW2-3]ATO20158.1 oxidoreductase [Acinetobacter sp. LoGeW2-3]